MGREQLLVKIAAEANCNPRTVRRYLDGNRVMPIFEASIVAAAKKLKISLKSLRVQ